MDQQQTKEEIEASTLPLPTSYLKLLQETEQNPRYHAEGNVLRHTEMVLAAYQTEHHRFDLDDSDHEVLYWAAVLHDLGKIQTTRWEKNRWRAKGHEEAGVPMVRELLLAKPEIKTSQRYRILELVRYHAIPLQWGLTDRPLEAYKRLATRTDLRLLGIFAHFDIVGRICEKKDQILGLIEHFNHEIVPRIYFEMGSFEELQQAFQQASHQHKNALWHSLRHDSTHLLEKLVQAPTRSGSEPLFTCVLPLGADGSAMRQHLALHYPGFLTFEVGEVGIDYRDKFERETQLRQLKHFVSVYGRDQQNLILAGLPVDSEVRRHVADYCRQQGAHLEYLFFEQRLEEMIREAESSEAVEAKKQAQAHLEFPHPWEAHRVRMRDDSKA